MIIQGEAKIPDIELVPHFNTIDFRLKTATVKQVQRAEKAASKIMGQMRFELPQGIVLQFLPYKSSFSAKSQTEGINSKLVMYPGENMPK